MPFYHWKVKEAADGKWHVLEIHPMDDPDKPWVMAVCTGPVPAGRIVAAMQLQQGLEESGATASNRLRMMQEELDHFRKQMKTFESSKESKL